MDGWIDATFHMNEVKNMILQNPTTLSSCDSQVSHMHLLIMMVTILDSVPEKRVM